MKKRMDLPKLEAAMPIVGESSEKVGDFGVTWLDEPPQSRRVLNRVDYADDDHDGDENGSEFASAVRLHSCDYCEWGYFGNESSYVDFYFYAALHIGIPPFGDGIRQKSPIASQAMHEGAGETGQVKKKAAAPKTSTIMQEDDTSRVKKPRSKP